MEIKLPNEITKITQLFNQAGYTLYLVGGAVRDALLNKTFKDWDFTTDATPEQILKVTPKGFYNNQFGTVGLETEVGIIEITTMRQESSYADKRHPSKITWTTKITEDLKRRDFTINAVAFDLQNQTLIDPFLGQKDLEQRIIRAVGDPVKRFQEDALRLVRAVRFATQLGFTIEENTFAAIKESARLVIHISWERIRDELLKIISSDFPYEGMLLLRSSGLLQFILPEVEKCFGVIQEGPKHDRIYDIGEHSLRTLKFCSSPDPIVRMACLLHDVGKLTTYHKESDGNVTFYGHDIVGSKIAEDICQRLRLSKKQTDRVVKLVRYHLFTVDEHQTDSALRRFIRNVGEENLDDIFILREADRLGGASNPSSWRTEHFKNRIKNLLVKHFTLSDLAVDGKDIMQTLEIKPGRKVGEILQKLFAEVEEDMSKNNREYLLQKAKQLV